jgi:hypothetical protein
MKTYRKMKKINEFLKKYQKKFRLLSIKLDIFSQKSEQINTLNTMKMMIFESLEYIILIKIF